MTGRASMCGAAITLSDRVGLLTLRLYAPKSAVLKGQMGTSCHLGQIDTGHVQADRDSAGRRPEHDERGISVEHGSALRRRQ